MTMDKYDVRERVSQNGRPLPLNLFVWDKKTNTFSSREDKLAIDFRGINGCTFTTGSFCLFATGYGCTFTTGYDCTFTTGFGCTFTTGSFCNFITGYSCTFTTGYGCTFNTGDGCSFTTGYDCTFITQYDCTFKTGDRCVIIRRGEIFEVIQPKEDQKVKLNNVTTKGFIVLDTNK